MHYQTGALLSKFTRSFPFGLQSRIKQRLETHCLVHTSILTILESRPRKEIARLLFPFFMFGGIHVNLRRGYEVNFEVAC